MNQSNLVLSSANGIQVRAQHQSSIFRHVAMETLVLMPNSGRHSVDNNNDHLLSLSHLMIDWL